MTCQGEYSQEYIEEWNRRFPSQPKTFTNQPKILFGGAGFGGKSYTARACMVELHARYLHLGVEFPITGIIANSYPNLADWQIRELKRKYPLWGEVRESNTFGVHFRFHNENWGVCLLRNADKPDKRGGNIMSAQIDEASLVPWEFIEDIIYATRSAEAPFNSLGFLSNPDGPYAAKLKKLFVDRDFDGEPEDSAIREEDFHPIIRANVWDNPAATEADHRRLRSFANETLVKARYYGEWDILTGLRFPQFARAVHTFDWHEFCRGFDIPALDDPAQYLKPSNGFEVYASLDFGTSVDSASACHLSAVDWKRRIWTFAEYWLVGQTLREQACILAEELRRFGVKRLYYDPSLDGKDDDGLSRSDKFRRIFRELKCETTMIPGSRDRIERWASIDEMLYYVRNPDTKEITQPPALKILRPSGGQGCPHLIRQFGEAPRHVTPAGNKLEDIDPMGGIWHAMDGFSYFAHTWFHAGHRPEQELIPGSNGWLRRIHDYRRQKRQRPPGW